MQTSDPGTGILQVLPQIKTPLMYAGLTLFVLYLLFRAQLDKMKTIMIFTLALVAECGALYGFLHTPPAPPAILDGVVYSPRGSNKGVPKATVYLAIQGNPVITDTTQATGYFGFPIKSIDFGKHAELYVSASGYNDSGMVKVNLAQTMDRADFWIDANEARSANADVVVQKTGPHANQGMQAVIPKAPAANTLSVDPVTCLDGNWTEVLKGRTQDALSNIWTFSLRGDELTVTRQDNFAIMNLSRFGQDFKGDLKWGNGDVWHNIAITPAKDCKTVDTNVAWSYINRDR